MTEAATTTATTDTTGTAGGNAPSSQTTVDVSWLGADAKPEVSTYVQGKGFKSAAAVAEAYINAEKALSTRPGFEMPKPDDAAGIAKLNAALGVPEAADKYDLGDAAKTIKPEALKEWTGLLHKHAIPNERAKGLIADVLAANEAKQVAQHNTYVDKTTKDAERIKLEMGDKWPAFHDIAQRGMAAAQAHLAKTVGKEAGEAWPQVIDAIERAGGTRVLFAIAQMIGESKVEAGFVSSDGQHRGMTKEGARAAMNGFRADPVKSRALMRADDPGHAAALNEWTQLRRIAEA